MTTSAAKPIAILAACLTGAVVTACGTGSNAAGGKAAAPTATVTATQTQTETQTETATATATVTLRPTVIKTTATHVRVRTVTYTPPVKVAFADGTYRVGSEIHAGTYHTDGEGSDGTGCYWERDGRGSGLDAIIGNDNIDGPTTIDISSSDYAFKSSGGCDWVRR